MAAEEALDRAVAEGVATLGQTRAKFFDGHVRGLFEHRVDQFALGLDAPRAPVPAKGARAGMGLRPATPIEPYEDLLPELDMLLVMTVEPGFGGQAFLDMCVPKIRRTRRLIEKHGLELWLQVDGGVSLDTIEQCADAGADVFVAGSAVFRADDPNDMIESLRASAKAASPL